MRRPVVLPIAYDRLVRRPDLSPRRPAALGNEHGWTLLELLVAVGIASLVFTVLLLMQQTVTSFVQRQEQRLDHTVRAARLLDGLSNELSGMFVLEGDESTAPQLKTDPRNGDIELTFWSASLRPLGDEPETVILQRIRYAGESRDGEFTIVRSESPSAGPLTPARASTNILTDAAAGFEVYLFDGESWRDQWPQDEGKPAPLAARVHLAWTDSYGFSVGATNEVFVAISGVVSSQLTRAVSP